MYEVNENNIWNFKQNNPELVVQDAKEFIGLNEEQCETLRKILLARGVNKWLKVRRDLIAYKKQIKHQLIKLEGEKIMLKSEMKVNGYDEKLYREYFSKKEVHKVLMKIRHDLRNMCNTERYQIWRKSTSHSVLREMNSINCSD